LTFAEYDEKYLEYLDGKHEKGDPTSFLTMHEAGPYDTQDGVHMANLAPLLALVLRADYDQQKAQEVSGGLDEVVSDLIHCDSPCLRGECTYPHAHRNITDQV
jgi:hypothetical protein